MIGRSLARWGLHALVGLAVFVAVAGLTGCGDATLCAAPQPSTTPDWALSLERCSCEELEDACGASCSLAWRNSKGVPQAGAFEATCEDVPCCAPL